MDLGKIGSRYAKAFFLSGKEKNTLDQYYNDIRTLQSLLEENKDIEHFFFNPVLSPSVKRNIMQKLFADYMHQDTISLLMLITNNKREMYIKDIIRAFITLYRKEKNIKLVQLTTASHLSSNDEQKIMQILKEKLQANIEITKIQDTSLIGGFILRIDDIQYNTSVSTKLQNIKKYLMETEIKN